MTPSTPLLYLPALMKEYPDLLVVTITVRQSALPGNHCEGRVSRPAVATGRHRRAITPIELPVALNMIVAVQLQTLICTGFGEYLVKTERSPKKQIQQCILTSPSFINYVDHDEEAKLRHWFTQLGQAVYSC